MKITGTSLLSKIGDDTTVETLVADDVVHIAVIYPRGGFGHSIPHDAAAILAVQLVAHMPESEWPEILKQAKEMNTKEVAPCREK